MEMQNGVGKTETGKSENGHIHCPHWIYRQIR